jgi:hypothetical protein
MIRSVVAVPFGHLAIGASDAGATVWLSTDDGATWAPFGEPVPEAYFSGAFLTDAGLVLTGATQTGTQETGIDARAMVWTATLGD